ncbi:hypothetical protein [Solibacillus sp. CAU 1738]|uniref:hypothetical protein n=1 Tax=Solibacillus sp. CAU 1738 TaxID=3140363 RepID=UPI00326036E7
MTPEDATLTSGILSLFGGLIGVMGAYWIATMQMSHQLKTIEKEGVKKARPYIICEEIRGSYKLQEINRHPESKILFSEYYEKNIDIATIHTEGFMNFFMFKFIGDPEYIMDCQIKLTMDSNVYEENCYDFYLDHMRRNVEIFIPLPFYINDIEGILKVEFDNIELKYSTTSKEKFKYVYSHRDLYQKIYLIIEGQEELISDKEVIPSNWILNSK